MYAANKNKCKYAFTKKWGKFEAFKFKVYLNCDANSPEDIVKLYW